MQKKFFSNTQLTDYLYIYCRSRLHCSFPRSYLGISISILWWWLGVLLFFKGKMYKNIWKLPHLILWYCNNEILYWNVFLWVSHKFIFSHQFFAMTTLVFKGITVLRRTLEDFAGRYMFWTHFHWRWTMHIFHGLIFIMPFAEYVDTKLQGAIYYACYRCAENIDDILKKKK